MFSLEMHNTIRTYTGRRYPLGGLYLPNYTRMTNEGLGALGFFKTFGRVMTGVFTLGLSEIPIGGRRLGEHLRIEPFVSTVLTGGHGTSGTMSETEHGIFSSVGKTVSSIALTAGASNVLSSWGVAKGAVGSSTPAGFGTPGPGSTFAKVAAEQATSKAVSPGILSKVGSIAKEKLISEGVSRGLNVVESQLNPIDMSFRPFEGPEQAQEDIDLGPTLKEEIDMLPGDKRGMPVQPVGPHDNPFYIGVPSNYIPMPEPAQTEVVSRGYQGLPPAPSIPLNLPRTRRRAQPLRVDTVYTPAPMLSGPMGEEDEWGMSYDDSYDDYSGRGVGSYHYCPEPLVLPNHRNRYLRGSYVR